MGKAEVCFMVMGSYWARRKKAALPFIVLVNT